jgi:DNA repair exonuclease SbcCD ATPase subunit
MQPWTRRIIFELVLGVVVAASLAIVLHLVRRLAEFERRHEADAQCLRLYHQAWLQKTLQQLPPPSVEVLPGGDARLAASKEATIERLDRELAEARARMADLQAQLASATEQNNKAAAGAQERLQQQQAAAQLQVDDLQKKLEAAQADASIARQRVSALEADNSKMRIDANSVNTQAAEAARLVAGLQDIQRRRDVYLNSILRRYRDITNDFRNMSGILDTSHDGNSGACSGAALSRIQTAVGGAEDDLRQINELDARTQKLEKQLLKK